MKIYHGTQLEVLDQMAQHHKQARQDMLNRKLAARQRKEEIEAQEENWSRLLHYDGGQINHLFGRKRSV